MLQAVFRVDSSNEIGTGHIMRCLTLADQLSKSKVDITFICRELPGNSNHMITKKGYELKILPPPRSRDTLLNNWLKVHWNKDANDTINFLVSKIDFLIIDHYGIDVNWHKKVSLFSKSYCD